MAPLSRDDVTVTAPQVAATPSSPSASTPPPPPLARDNAIARQLRGSVPAASVGAVAPQAGETLLHMQNYVAALFAPYKNGGNDAAIDGLAASRATTLHENGETVAKLQSLFTYAHLIDLSAHMAAGGSGALPFAVANALGGQLANWMPTVKDVRVGLLSGVLTYLLVHIGNGVNGRTTAHTPWLRPTDLHPDMAAALEGMQPGAVQKYKEMLSFQGFPLTFATVGELPVLGHLHSPKAGSKAQSIGEPLTALVGGVAVAGIDKTIEEKMHRSGPALLLASESWDTQLEQIRQRHDMSHWHDRAAATLAGGVRQTGAGLVGKLGQGLLDGARELRDHPATTLGSALIWGGGIAGSTVASNHLGALLQEHGVPDAAIAAAKQIVFAASLSPINLTWAAALAFGPALDAKFVGAVRSMWHGGQASAGNGAATSAATQV